MSESEITDKEALDALQRYGTWYLSRYGSISIRQFRRKLRDKLARLGFAGDCDALIDTTVKHALTEGHLDESEAARYRTRKLVGRGWAPSRIRADLAQRGMESASIAEALGDDDQLAMQAAMELARRRRLGPWRDPETENDDYQAIIDRERRILASRGFSYRLTMMIIGAKSVDELLRR